MTRSIRVFALVITIVLACSACLTACAPVSNVVKGSTPETGSTATAAPTPIATPSPSPVPPESLTYKQKADMIGSRVGWGSLNKPSRIYIFYLESKDQDRLVWVKQEEYPSSNGFNLLDVFNGEILFHVSIDPKDIGKVTPSEYPKYVDHINDSLSQYSIVAAGKMLDINDLYANNKIEFTGAGKPYDALSPYLRKTQTSFDDWSIKETLAAFIDATPAQYILPIWEYIPNAVTPDSYFNPPSPTPVLTPMPDDLKELLLGIGKNSEPCKVGTIQVYNYELKGKKFRCWVYSYHNKEKSIESNGCEVDDIFEIFTGQYLFSISLPNNGIDKDGQDFSISQYAAYMSETNPALKGMKLEHAFGLSEVAYYYRIWNIDYNNDEFLNGFCEYFIGDYTPEDEMELESTRQTFLPVDFMKEVFLNSTPQEEIMPFWVFTPGAQIPEELKGIYSEEEYPPAPAE